MNRVVLAGNLTQDATLHMFDPETGVANFSIALNKKYRDRKTGEIVDKPTFIQCQIFGRRAPRLAPWLKKGTKVIIDGSLRQSVWMKDDERRSSISVDVEHLEFARPKPKEMQEPSVRQPTYQPPYGQQQAYTPPQQPNYSPQQEQYIYNKDIPF